MTGSAGRGVLRACGREFAWGPGTAPHLMAVVNATPDSFSDGGAFLDAAAAQAHGISCMHAGAAIVDVGGESTRPGAARVAAGEQVRRVEPVIRALAPLHPVSVDTTRAEVARAALSAGACMVNDVSAGMEDPALLEVVAASGAAVVLMHRLAAPDADRWSTEPDPRRRYGDVVRDIRDWLGGRVEAARRVGVGLDRIVVDPGLGFGKDVAQNIALLRGVPELAALGVPVLVGASRKSFLGAICGEPEPSSRDAASVAAALVAASGGAAILRVHEVAMHRQAMRVWSAATVEV